MSWSNVFSSTEAVTSEDKSRFLRETPVQKLNKVPQTKAWKLSHSQDSNSTQALVAGWEKRQASPCALHWVYVCVLCNECVSVWAFCKGQVWGRWQITSKFILVHVKISLCVFMIISSHWLVCLMYNFISHNSARNGRSRESESARKSLLAWF